MDRGPRWSGFSFVVAFFHYFSIIKTTWVSYYFIQIRSDFSNLINFNFFYVGNVFFFTFGFRPTGRIGSSGGVGSGPRAVGFTPLR